MGSISQIVGSNLSEHFLDIGWGKDRQRRKSIIKTVWQSFSCRGVETVSVVVDLEPAIPEQFGELFMTQIKQRCHISRTSRLGIMG
jgi:hypothetical protein